MFSSGEQAPGRGNFEIQFRCGSRTMNSSMNETLVAFLSQRRSSKAAMLTEPGPDQEQLETILRIGARVPDHKKLAPWRFIIFRGAARARMGEVFAQACLDEDDPQASAIRLETERTRFLRAPVVIALVSSVKDKPGVPEFEQVLSAGAVGLNTCLAANALGFGSQWLTEWIASSPRVARELELSASERIAAFIYIGTAREQQSERDRPDMSRVVTYWPET